MLDTGSIGNSDYYLYVIARTDTGVVDIICSLAAPSVGPVMPTDYDFFRAIGWFKRAGGIIVAFFTYETEGGGLDYYWDDPPQDVNLSNTLSTTARTDTLSVPTDFSTIVSVNVYILDGTTAYAYISNPDVTDEAASLGDGLAFPRVYVASQGSPSKQRIRTSATGQIRARGSISTLNTYAVTTLSFEWSRR